MKLNSTPVSFNVARGKELVRKNDRMTMLQLRKFVNDNNLFYQRVPGSRNLVAIYYDRYHNEKLGYVLVKDYRPIKNFRSIKFGFFRSNEVLPILKRNITIENGIIQFKESEEENINTKGDTRDYEVIKAWLEGKI